MKQVFNPYLPLNEYIPDGEPHVFGDRVYIYGSHDKESGEYFCMLDYVTYSAPVDNLRDWRYEGVIYRASQDPDYPNHKYMYAPDVVRGNDGRYYLYYSLADQRECSFLMSVAVCDTPCGEFKFLGYVKNPDGTPLQDFVIFDPGLINDNGHIYLYYGVWYDFYENPKFTPEQALQYQSEMFRKPYEEIENTEGGVMGPVCVELCDDMLTVKHKPKHIFPTTFKGTPFEGYEFFEASSMRKVGDKYYFIYSTFNQHELAYATSDCPDRDFKFGGVIISNGDIGYKGRKPKDRVNRTGNNHGSIEKIGDDFYVFYHRQTHRTDYSRQACAEKIQILPDGTIPQVEVTSCGLNYGPLVAKGEYPAVICCNLTNGKMPHTPDIDKVQIPYIVCKNGERIITEVNNGTAMVYKYFKFDGVNEIGLNIRALEEPNGKILVKLSENGDSIAQIPVPNAVEWTKISTKVSVENGTYGVYFVYEGEGKIEVKSIFMQ